MSLLQCIKLINQLLADYNRKPYTNNDIISFFNQAYDSWIYEEYINDRVERIAKPYLQALNNKVDEQILIAITDSVLVNLNFAELKDKFMDLLVDNLKIKINDENILYLAFINIHSSYFSTLIRKYKYDNFTNTVNYIINTLIGDNSTKAKRPLDPAEFQNLTDEEDPIDNILTSTIKPINFVNCRNAAVVILDQKVLAKQKDHLAILADYRQECLDKKTKSYNPQGKTIFEEFNISNLAVGSIFGSAVLLEYITNSVQDNISNGNINSNNGNLEIIKKALQNKGYKKIYLQQGSPFLSRQYQRKAKLISAKE